jgi:hypothetical protein
LGYAIILVIDKVFAAHLGVSHGHIHGAAEESDPECDERKDVENNRPNDVKDG